MKFLILDLETTGLDPVNDEITCIGYLKSWEGKETCLINKGYKDSEKEILSQFWDLLEKENPDFLVGWNIDNFDWRFLKIRSLIKNVKISRYYKKRHRIDLMLILRTPRWKSLDSYSVALFNDSKYPLDTYLAFRSKDFASLKKYNMQDLRLTFKIFKRCLDLGLINLENGESQ